MQVQCLFRCCAYAYSILSMKKAILLIALILALTYCRITAHSGKPLYRVIIDTDCAVDDFRAITLLLASPKIEVLGITTSDGTLDPVEGRKRVESLLESFHHEGIPVARGEKILKSPPQWRDLNKKISWTDQVLFENNNNSISAQDFIIETINSEQKAVTLICLGSLFNIASAIQKEDSIIKKIERIIWYNGKADLANGTNYRFDKISADYILESGIRVEILLDTIPDNNDSWDTISSINDTRDSIPSKNDLWDSIPKINSIYAGRIFQVHQQNELKNSIHKGYLNLWDDLVPVYMLNPAVFSVNSISQYHNVVGISPADLPGIKSMILNMLDIDKHTESLVFHDFPDDPELFKNDVSQAMNEIIGKHGLTEWRLGVLANELHGHLGIYAIVGVKMGLRAREFFNIGLDDIRIVSFAGRVPPLSCMNDGLQVSTGGTLGHGLIFLTDDSKVLPKALFSYKNKTVIIRLKDEYKDIIKNNIKECISENGYLKGKYWECVRKLALEYWLEWDRNTMFELEY